MSLVFSTRWAGATLAAVTFIAICVPAANAAEVSPDRAARLERITDRLIEMLPIGEVFEHFASKDAQWPLQGGEGRTTAEQLACMRAELSRKGFRRNRLGEVQSHYESLGDARINDDLKIVEAAAPLVGRMVQGGFGIDPDKKADVNAILGSASPTQIQAMLEFLQSPDNRELRKLSGFGEAFDPDQSKEQNAANGRNVGRLAATRTMSKAMEACSVPMASII